VIHPKVIGTRGHENIVVKVNKSGTVPVEFAKVCLQKGNELYKVGYTNHLGYVEFDFNVQFDGEMNITVTKHNCIPYIEEIEVRSSDADIILMDPFYGKAGDRIDLTLYGFTSFVNVYFDNTQATLISPPLGCYVPSGPAGPVNVIVNQSDGRTATTVFYRLNGDETDPYFELPAGRFSLSIIVFDKDAGHTVLPSLMDITHSFTFKVDVFNAGFYDSRGTVVTLAVHPYGAGLSAEPAASSSSFTVTGSPSGPPHSYKSVTIDWDPLYPGSTCLIFEIVQVNDVDTSNNIGQVNAEIIGVNSPGNSSFKIGNNESTSEYPFLKLHQQGSYLDYWPATVIEYSSYAIGPFDNESVKFYIEVPDDVLEGQWRIFTVELYIKGEYRGEIEMTVVKGFPPTDPVEPPGVIDPVLIIQVTAAVVGLIVIVVVLHQVVKRRR
jgi:hypothetical protein